MNNEDIYYWNTNVPNIMKDPKNRYYKLLSTTLTHAYLKHMRSGYRFNISLKTFKNDYVKANN